MLNFILFYYIYNDVLFLLLHLYGINIFNCFKGHFSHFSCGIIAWLQFLLCRFAACPLNDVNVSVICGVLDCWLGYTNTVKASLWPLAHCDISHNYRDFYNAHWTHIDLLVG